MIPIFVAIDTSAYFVAEELLYQLGDHVDVKIGLEFFVANGPDAVVTLLNKGANRPRQLFLDLKFHDIPNTVAGAVRSALPMEPDFITLHTCEGIEPLNAAMDVVNNHSGKRPKLLGVLSLTSNDYINPKIFVERINYVNESGLDGIICPPSQTRNGMVKNFWKNNIFLMVPGIRMVSPTHDQKDVTTPRQAMLNGADALVIGREITTAKDPLKAVLAIKETLIP